MLPVPLACAGHHRVGSCNSSRSPCAAFRLFPPLRGSDWNTQMCLPISMRRTRASPSVASAKDPPADKARRLLTPLHRLILCMLAALQNGCDEGDAICRRPQLLPSASAGGRGSELPRAGRSNWLYGSLWHKLGRKWSRPDGHAESRPGFRPLAWTVGQMSSTQIYP